MPANQIGLSFHRTGWTGSVTITKTDGGATRAVDSTGSTSRSVADFLNAIETAGESLVGGGFKWAVSTSGIVTISSAVAFSLSFTGTTAARLGFSGSQTGGASYTATSAAGGLFAPYASESVFYSNDVRAPAVPGVATGAGAIWMRTPASDPIRPTVFVECQRSKVLHFIEAHAVIGTPSKVDSVDDHHDLDAYHLGAVRVNERSDVDGWALIELEVVG